MKKGKKILSFFLTVLTVIGIFSCATTVWAEEYNEYIETKAYEEKLLTETVYSETEKAEIIFEVEEKRDEFSKTYKRTDGSYTSVVSQTPLHRLKDGQWENIDNTLIADGDILKNADGSFDIEFPETISENEKITVTNNGESIAFSVNNIDSSPAVVTVPETDNKDIIEQDLSKVVSEITYESIDKNTDIQYVVSPGFVKENIIVNDKSALKDTYSFDIEKGNLTATLDDSNNLTFKNEKTEIAFTIPAPVMKDANNVVSYDIDVTIKNADKSVLTLIYSPSKEWLNSKDRAYPIIIDPVVMLPDADDTIIQDTVILNKADDTTSKSTNYSNSVEGLIKNTQAHHSEILVKIDVNTVAFCKKPNIEIIDVNYFGTGFVTGGNVIVKPINGEWSNETITYNDVYPSDNSDPVITYENKIIDYFTGTPQGEENDPVTLYFNITQLFKEWLTGERSNDGFAIVAEDNQTTGIIYLAGDLSTNGKTFNTFFTIDYVDVSGNNDSFEYLTQEIGRAGTAYVNTFARSLSLNRSDLSMGGLRLSAGVSFNYDPAVNTFVDVVLGMLTESSGSSTPLIFPYGNNWLPNYFQCIVMLAEGEYQFFTEEGTVVAFKQTEETVTETIDGVETTTTATVFKDDETSDSGYTLELINQENSVTVENMKITAPDGNELYFNNNGFLSKVREPEANSDGTYDEINIVTVENNAAAIDYISDGVGRKYDFVYDTETGLLSEINCLTADGTQIKAGTTNEDLSVTYTYDENRNLTSVTYPDGKSVAYTYSDNSLIKAKNIDNYNIQYTNDSLGKITKITEKSGDIQGNFITLEALNNRQVKITDAYTGVQIQQFGKDGKLHYTFDDKGNYYKSDGAVSNDNNIFPLYEWKTMSENLLKNGSFEETSVLQESRAKYWTSEFQIADLPTQQIESNGDIIGYNSATFGNKSYLISSTDNCTDFVSQTVEVDNISSYTFSAFVRSEIIGELSLKIAGIDSSGNIDKEEAVTITSTNGWERFSITYTPSNEFVPTEITVSIGFENNKGSYFVDCVQLETGLGTAEYNFVQNGSFNNTDEYWSNSTISTDLINGKNVNVVKLAGCLPHYTQNIDQTYTLNDGISAVTQNIEINGKKGEIYSVGGWFKGLFDDNYINPDFVPPYATSSTQLTSSLAQLKITYSYTETVTETAEDGTTISTEETITENFVVDFSPHNDGWQYMADSFALKGDVDSVDITIVAKNVSEDCFATGIELALDNNAISFIENVQTITPETQPDTETESNETEITECPCEDCEELDCICRCENSDLCICIQCIRRNNIEVKSDDEKTITTQSFDGEKYIQTSFTYSNDMNNIISETDSNNVSTGYSYKNNGCLTMLSDNAGNVTTYQSNAMGYLSLAESNVSGLTDNVVKMAISYIYDGDLLTKVNQGNIQYTYEYDEWSQLKRILVDDETLICYNYGNGANRTRVTSIIFGGSEQSGFTIKYTYSDGNITKVEKYRLVEGEKDSITYDYKYDNLGNLDYIKDNGTGHFIDYTDYGIVIKDYENGTVIYETKDIEVSEDEASNITSISQEIANGTAYNHKIYESEYSAETGKTTETEAISVVTASSDSNFTYGKTIGTKTISDWFGRNEAVTVMTKDPSDTTTTDFASISSQYGYVTNGNVTSNLISSVTNTITGEDTKTVNYNYTYDSNGRIINASTVSSVPNLSGASQYVYDEAGQLIKEITGSTICEYAYDSKGNISSRKVYSGETLVSTDTFAYGANTWEDRLTGYNNKAITYDSIGNPTSYLGATLSWRGRELSGYSEGNKQISYSYDVDGMRYQKIVKTDGTETARYDYVYSDRTLILLTYTANGASNTARFVYDFWGEPRGFMLNDNATYLYLKNAQGDITAIVDEKGEILVRYTYNAWGAVDFVVPFGVDPGVTTILATVSPFTYRGYCYDYDIGMYYLQSRYYDPTICRFINADSTDYLGATGTLLSFNLFAYCENDGVNSLDSTGTWGKAVHYSDTKTWAKNVGYNSTESKTIAEADQGMDNIKNHAMFIWNQHIHFNTNVNKGIDSRMVYAMTMLTLACVIWENSYSTYLEEIREAEKNYSGYNLSKKKRDLFVDLNNNKGYCIQMVGQGLHAIQDIEGHGQTEPTIEVFDITLTQHLVSSGGKKKHKSDNTWYSWKNNKTHLYFDISRERYYDTKDDSLFYLRSFFDFRNELYKQKYKEYFSKKEYQFNGFCM